MFAFRITYFMLFLDLLFFMGNASAQSLLDEERYDAFLQKFMPLEAKYLSEIKFSELSNDERSQILYHRSKVPLGLKATERKANSRRTAQFGIAHWCSNNIDQSSFCFMSTGGSKKNKSEPCGKPINEDMENALNTDYHCAPGEFNDWYGAQFWLGTGNNHNYVADAFPEGDTRSFNRLCFEFEFPLDRAYALDERTLVACIGPNPSGVRSGMRPTYVANPLLTVTGANMDYGTTNAYSYLNYLTRIYLGWSFSHKAQSSAIHPLNIKLNRVFMAYERDHMFAIDDNGGVLATGLVNDQGYAQHKFNLVNLNDTQRTLRVFMVAGGNLPFNESAEHFKLVIDENENGIRDEDETPLVPQSLLILPPNKILKFIVLHSPDFQSNDQSPKRSMRYDRHHAQASVTFQEVNSMRSASYAFRTWQRLDSDNKTDTQILSVMHYPHDKSPYKIYAELNEDPENPRLIRHYPDYKEAWSKLMCKYRRKNVTDDLLSGLGCRVE